LCWPFGARILTTHECHADHDRGIAISTSALAREATEFVRDVSTQLLFDHSRRVVLWASL
jgi:hypothetical protein